MSTQAGHALKQVKVTEALAERLRLRIQADQLADDDGEELIAPIRIAQLPNVCLRHVVCRKLINLVKFYLLGRRIYKQVALFVVFVHQRLHDKLRVFLQ